MPNYLKRFSLSSLLVIFLAVFTILNQSNGLDILALLIIAGIILQKLFGEYFILILMAIRPTLDYWRDYNLFSFRSFDFNTNAALSIFLLAWSVYFFVKNSRYFKDVPTRIAWLAFIAWCSITAIYSYDLVSTIRETIKAANLFSLFGICYIMYIKDGPQFKKEFMKALIAGASIPLLVGVYQFFTKTGLDIDGIANRIYGTFAHPNILATYALLLLMVVVNELFINKDTASESPLVPILENRGSRLTVGRQSTGRDGLAVGLFLLTIIALTYTRIAWLGAGVLFIIIGLVYYRKILFYTLTGVALFYVAFYPVNDYLKSSYNFNLQSFSLISRLTARNEDSDSIKWRTDVASRVLPLFKKKILFGYGYGSFPRVWDDNKDIGNIWDTTSEAHDDYIKVAFESGIIGLILFLSIFLSLLYMQISFGVKNRWTNIVFIASIAIYLVLSLSDNMLHHTPMIWWLWAVWGVWMAEFRAGAKEVV